MKDANKASHPRDTITTSIVGCARCHGEGHDDLTFKPLTHPFDLDSEPSFTHWATCPTNGEPILLRIQTEDDNVIAAVVAARRSVRRQAAPLRGAFRMLPERDGDGVR